METQKLADQLGWCITSRDYLQQLDSELRHVTRQHFESLQALRSQNYMDEYLQRLTRLAHEFSDQAEATVRHIEQEHMTYIDQQARLISSVLSDLR